MPPVYFNSIVHESGYLPVWVVGFQANTDNTDFGNKKDWLFSLPLVRTDDTMK